MVERQVEPQEAGRIGALLRERRGQSGYEIAEIAQFLRIRQPHLRAIEAGHFEDLPGPAYAAGFVRTYAEFLGLDASDIGHRLQAAMLPAPAAAPLNLPQPQAETATPKAGILLIGTLIACVAYGGWYLTSAHRPDVAGLTAAPHGQPETYAAGRQQLPARTAVTTTAVATTAAPGLARPGAEPERSPQRPDPAAAMVQPSRPGAPAGAEAPPAATATVSVQAASARGLPPADATAEADSQIVPQPQMSPTTSTAMAAEPPAPAESAASLTAARIVLKAKSDSWVEVRDPQSNTLLVARLLRAGDAYDVPDRPGLKLVTGNAGGLAIVVDGEGIASLGKEGAVRRNITLDPDVLRRVADSGGPR